jgi:MFS transporter, DHA1 family, multidrug resistance protein
MIRGETLTAARRFELIFLFGTLTVFTPIAIDMYLPALPAIAGEFHSSIAVIEHSLASYFLGVAVGQAVVGPVSDRFGRKIPLLVGLGFYVLGSAVCALAPGPLSLDVARFVQATGGCAGSVLARACVRDIFPPGQAARIFAQMLLVLSVSPLFAPLFGGWLLLITSWRYLFWIQAGLAALAVVAVILRLPESHPGSDRAIHPVAVMRDYAVIARDRRFLGYVMASTLSGAGLYVYLTGWPHVVIDIFHVPPQYFGFTFLLNGIGLIVVSQATAKLLHHRPAPHLLFWALVAQAGCGGLALLFSWMGWGGLFGLLPWVFLYCSLIGAVSPTASGLALMGFGASAGMASALMGIIVYGGGTIASLVMGSFTPESATPMAALICLCGFAALAANHYWSAPVLEPPAPTR